MARVNIDMPNEYPFSTELEVRIQHINRGNHVGNDALISFLNEARVRFLPEQINNPALDGNAMINADLAVIYKSEAMYGEVLCVEIAPGDYHKRGFDLFFRVTEKTSGREVAHAKMGMLLFDFAKKQLAEFDGGVEDFIAEVLASHNATMA